MILSDNVISLAYLNANYDKLKHGRISGAFIEIYEDNNSIVETGCTPRRSRLRQNRNIANLPWEALRE